MEIEFTTKNAKQIEAVLRARAAMMDMQAKEAMHRQQQQHQENNHRMQMVQQAQQPKAVGKSKK